MTPETRVGTEVEYPATQPENSSTTYKNPARYSGNVYDQVHRDYGRDGWPDATVTSDPTAGLELTSDPMHPDALADWYEEAITQLSTYSPFEPCGVSGNTCAANTIGLHLHMSPFSDDAMRALYEMSKQSWFRIFTCSSLAEGYGTNTYKLFRDNYCSMNFQPDETRSNYCVRKVDELNNHWEWRLLEPVTTEHFKLVMEFVKKLKESPVDAASFARELVNSGDERLTAIKRAKELNITEKLDDEESESNGLLERYDVSREVSWTGDVNGSFMESVYIDSHTPYIYRVHDTDGGMWFFVMYSDNYGPQNTFSNHGVEYGYNSVLRANDVETEVTGQRASELREAVEQFRDNRRTTDETRKTKDTEELIKVLNQ